MDMLPTLLICNASLFRIKTKEEALPPPPPFATLIHTHVGHRGAAEGENIWLNVSGEVPLYTTSAYKQIPNFYKAIAFNLAFRAIYP
jgi:hypothetical protein